MRPPTYFIVKIIRGGQTWFVAESSMGKYMTKSIDKAKLYHRDDPQLRGVDRNLLLSI